MLMLWFDPLYTKLKKQQKNKKNRFGTNSLRTKSQTNKAIEMKEMIVFKDYELLNFVFNHFSYKSQHTYVVEFIKDN